MRERRRRKGGQGQRLESVEKTKMNGITRMKGGRTGGQEWDENGGAGGEDGKRKVESKLPSENKTVT